MRVIALGCYCLWAESSSQAGGGAPSPPAQPSVSHNTHRPFSLVVYRSRALFVLARVSPPATWQKEAAGAWNGTSPDPAWIRLGAVLERAGRAFQQRVGEAGLMEEDGGGLGTGPRDDWGSVRQFWAV